MAKQRTGRKGDPLQLKEWLEEREEQIGGRWRARVRDREGRYLEEEGFLGTFLDTLVHFLPFCVGPEREEAEQAWAQANHLFGSFALHRGLAAGEVVEEVGFLREEILKLLLEESPWAPGERIGQMDLLALNRALDLAAVRASVAYVDDLFFAYLQGSGVPEGMSPELEQEMTRQLRLCLRDLEEIRSRNG
jgi:hypothetical protein